MNEVTQKLINVDLKTLEAYIDIFIEDKSIQNLFYKMINDIRYTIEEKLYAEL